jgi:hypothetical protein
VNGPWDLTEPERQEQRQKREDFMGDWCSLNYAKSEEQYEERWVALKQKYHEYRVLISYLGANQHPQRKEVAAPWTSRFRHYGHVTTSKLESSHNQVKTCLPSSTGHLLDVVQRLVNYWDDCYREYEAKLLLRSVYLGDEYLT